MDLQRNHALGMSPYATLREWLERIGDGPHNRALAARTCLGSGGHPAPHAAAGVGAEFVAKFFLSLGVFNI